MDDNLKSALICRGCMKTDGLLLSMYDADIGEKQLPNKLEIVASIKVEEDDDLPNVLCTKCAYRTDAFYNFKIQVQEAEQQLRMMLELQKQSLTNRILDDIEEPKHLQHYCQYNLPEPENDTIPDVLINGTNIPHLEEPLANHKINKDDLQGIESPIINSNEHNQFLLFNDKLETMDPAAYLFLSYIANENENKDMVLNECNYDSVSHIQLNRSNGSAVDNGLDDKSILTLNYDHEVEKCENDDSIDSDTDNYFDTGDNLLGSLNDTMMRIKELKSDSGHIQYQCTLCMHNYSALTEILTHTVDNHIPNGGPYYCVVCEKDCNNQKELRSHVKTHTGPNPYTCFICNKAYSMKRYLKRHMTCHTDFARYRCSKCGSRFKIKADLDNHTKTHSDGAPYSCNQCNKIFNYKATYKRHLIMHLDPDGLRLPKYPCCICSKRFVNNRTLKIHMRVHTGEKPFKCHICSRSFSQQGNLLNHVKIHSDPRRYTCDICGKKFNQRATLRDHTLLHTGEKPYVCNVCGLAFTFGAALRRHMWTHADDKPLGCDICQARFVGKYDLKRHMKIHWDKSTSKRSSNSNSNSNTKKSKIKMGNIVDDSNDINAAIESCQLQDDIILTQVAAVPETIFIEHVLIDDSKDQIVVSQEDSEKENVDALFHLIEYT